MPHFPAHIILRASRGACSAPVECMAVCPEAADELVVLVRRGQLFCFTLCLDCGDKLEGVAGRAFPQRVSMMLDESHAADGTASAPVTLRGRMCEQRSRAPGGVLR